jgi:hypothetical protein
MAWFWFSFHPRCKTSGARTRNSRIANDLFVSTQTAELRRAFERGPIVSHKLLNACSREFMGSVEALPKRLRSKFLYGIAFKGLPLASTAL